MSARDKVKLGILGAGEMAARHIDAVAASSDIEIVGVSWAGESGLRRISESRGVRAYSDPTELLNICDAVDVCLPTFLHEEAVLQCAAAGKHVLCEKPLALTPHSAKKMIDACDETGIIFMAAHCLRFWPEYVFLIEAADEKRFGAPVSFTAWRFGGMPGWASGAWLLDVEKSGGPALDLQIHDIDIAQRLFGMPGAVNATEMKKESIMAVSTALNYKDGPVVRCDAGWYFKDGYKFRQGYRAAFEGGIIEFHSDRENGLVVFQDGEKPLCPEIVAESAYRSELEYFCGCVRDGEGPARSSAADGAKAVAIAAAAIESAADGKSKILMEVL